MIEFESPLLSRVITLLPTLSVGALGLVALIGEYGRRQITRVTRSEFRDDPGKWSLGAAEELTLTASDGVRIHAWLFRAPGTAPTIIACHGHGGNKQTMLPVAGLLYPRYNVLLLDSRGHGESEGSRTTVGYEERLDVHAAADELTRRGLGPIGILGISMGASIAILAAAEDERIAAVVADSPFARLRWAVTEVALLRGYPRQVAPFIAWAGCRVTALRLGYPMGAFDPVEVVDRIAPRPLLLMHGAEDQMINVRHARLLYERAREPKSLWILEGLGHCRGLESMYDEYRARVLRFFDAALPAPGATHLVGA